MTAKKKKTLTAIGAVALAAVIALSGTFAWQSISQTALNEAAAALNPGGRLHDDFDGRNKDVYVENFTDAADGTPIFARVRLDEYMELGLEAGKDRNLSSDEPLTATGLTVVGEGAQINDKTTWTTRTPNSGLADEAGDVYWAWDMDGGQTVYMPTFNKNKDSLAADINGTYEGTNPGDETHYDDYKTYTVGYEVNDEAVYDADSNDVEDENVDRVTEPHTAKPTINGTVITMTEWLTRWEVYQATPDPTDEDKAQVMGDFWVWDDDGWAYWANAIQPDTATGLLLDGIELVNPPSDNYYYGVNVVGQFVTADDIGFLNGTGFYDTSNGKDTIPSENAEALIELLTGTKIDITRVEITGPDSIDRGKFADYTATVLKGGNAVEDAEVTWSLIGGKHSDTEVYSTGRVNVQSFEEANELTLVASYTGANGETVTGSKKIEVTTPPANVSFSAPSATSPTVYQYGSLTLEASVKLNNRDVTGAKVTWSIADKTSADTKVESTGDLTGTLTVGKDEPVGNKITVTVSYYDPNVKQTLTASKAITVQEAWQTQVENATAFVDSGSASNTVTIDGIKWKVLVKDDEKQQALIWAAEPVDSIWFDKIDGATETNDDYTSVWRDASIRTWLQNWLESETEALKAAAVETTISTRDSSLEYGALNTADRGMEVSNQWIETQDKVFLLSEADLFGTYQGDADLVDPRDYTYNGMQLTTKITQRRFDWTSYGWAWLRNASSYSNMQNPHRNWYLAGVYYTGYSTTDPDNHISGSELSLYVDNQYGNVLPALWVDYSMD